MDGEIIITEKPSVYLHLYDDNKQNKIDKSEFSIYFLIIYRKRRI